MLSDVYDFKKPISPCLRACFMRFIRTALCNLHKMTPIAWAMDAKNALESQIFDGNPAMNVTIE
jgi:hypothetical protein